MLAPEHTGTGPAEDAFDAITWILGNAEALNVDPGRIAVMGDSGGDGVAAGAAILAREKGIALAKQILIYPMLDDRNVTPDPAIAPYVGWNWDSNWTCWHALLGDSIGADGVSAIAAPGRLTDFRDLPQTYIEVGELDIFRDESMRYAQGLYHAGISCELSILAGVAHGHDRMSVEIEVARSSLANRGRILGSL